MTEPAPLTKRLPNPNFYTTPLIPRQWYIPTPSPSTTLCPICAHINIPYLLFATPFSAMREEIPLDTISSLLSRRNSCAFCALVVSTFYHSHGVDETERVGREEGGEAKVYLIALPRNVFRCQREGWGLRVGVRPVPKGWEGDNGRAVGYIGEGEGDGVVVGEVVDWVRAIVWIGRCVAGGGVCEEVGRGGEEREALPKGFRLVDVVDWCVVDADEGFMYYALSYVWGEKRGWLELKEGNKGDLMEKGGLKKFRDEIPATIRDAMEVVPKLIGRYLWVDALCIVQDSTDDMKEQIAGMRTIYGRARAVIAATAGKDCNAGLPGLRKGSRKVNSTVESIQGLPLACRPFDFSDAIDKSHWNTRGWTYQERLLGSRVLFFTEEQTFFKCPHMEDPLSEDTVGWGNKRNNSVHPTNDGGRDFLLQDHAINTLLYEQSVQAYSKRNLKDTGDVLDAFAGVTEHMSLIFRSRMMFGMPENELTHSLLWQPDGKCERRTNLKQQSIFPSWSWCGWIGKVTYHHACRLLLSRIVFVDEGEGLITEEQLRRPASGNPGGRPWWEDNWTQVITNATRTHYYETDRPSKLFAHPVAPMKDRDSHPKLIATSDGALKFWTQIVNVDTKGYVPPDKIDSPEWVFNLNGKDGLGHVGGWMSTPSHFLQRLGQMKLALVRIARSRSSSEPEDNGWEDKLKAESLKAAKFVPSKDDPLAGMRDDDDLDSTRAFFPDREVFCGRPLNIDEQRFDMKKPFCLVQLLLVEWLDDGTARRVGRATCHIDFWAQEKPVEKLVILG